MFRAEPTLSAELAGPAEVAADDAAWLARIRAGDENAAHALVQRLYPMVMRLVYCHHSRRTSAEDLAQAIFLKIFAKLDQFSGRVPLEHWVARIAINTCLNELRLERHRPEVRMADFNEEEQAVIQQLLHTSDDVPLDQTQEARELLDQLFAKLKPAERLVLVLLHLEERSAQEISQLTGWSVSLVKVRAFRARLKLRRLWDSLSTPAEHRSLSNSTSCKRMPCYAGV